MKVAALTAYLGPFSAPVDWVRQDLPTDVTFDVHAFTDANFPPRTQTMTPRLQARIPKMFGWSLRPGYDAYLWLDSKMSLLTPDCLTHWIAALQGHDLVVFRHPDRHTIAEEAAFIAQRIADGNAYLTERYKGEFLDEQMACIHADSTYVDDRLYASTALMYRNVRPARAMLEQWWIHTSRFHAVDQLAFPYVVRQAALRVHELDGIYDSPYCTHTDNHTFRRLHPERVP
jgi:hypothetical protein